MHASLQETEGAKAFRARAGPGRTPGFPLQLLPAPRSRSQVGQKTPKTGPEERQGIRASRVDPKYSYLKYLARALRVTCLLPFSVQLVGDEWTVIIPLAVVSGAPQPPCICGAELETWGQDLCGG